MKNPPILISILGFFAALAGFAWLFLGLRILGFDWFGIFGDLPKYESVGIWGWLITGLGLLWLAAAIGLWAMQPWAWMFAMVIAGFALLEAFIWFIQYPGSGVGFGMGILPFLIILYLNGREVRAAFGLTDGAA
jgi:hypothetical protein